MIGSDLETLISVFFFHGEISLFFDKEVGKF